MKRIPAAESDLDTTGLVEEDEPGPRPSPRVVDQTQEEDEVEIELGPGLISAEKTPLFEGVRVVYLGSNPHKAPVLPGRIVMIQAGNRQIPQTRNNNHTSYDFTAYDEAGDKNPRRIGPDHPKAELRDRPFQWVQHADHIYRFARLPMEFRLLIAPESVYGVKEYIARRERLRKENRQFLRAATA